MKSRIQTCVAYFSSALCCSLCLCLFFLFSLCLCCVYLLSFSVRAFFFFLFSRPPLFFFLTCACLSLSIYREILLSTDQIMEQFSSVFCSTAPNFMFSRDPLFNLFLFSLFRCLLNFFFLVCDNPLSPNCVPHFLVVIFLYSLFSFSIILLLYLLLPVAIFNSLSLFFFVLFYFYLFRDNGRLTFGSPPSLIFFTLFS